MTCWRSLRSSAGTRIYRIYPGANPFQTYFVNRRSCSEFLDREEDLECELSGEPGLFRFVGLGMSLSASVNPSMTRHGILQEEERR